MKTVCVFWVCALQRSKNMSENLQRSPLTPAAASESRLTLPGTISSIRVFLLWYGAIGSTYHSGQLMLLAPLLPTCLAPSWIVDDVLPAIISCRLPLRPDLTSAVLSRSLSDRQVQSVATTALEAHAAVAVVPEGLGLVLARCLARVDAVIALLTCFFSKRVHSELDVDVRNALDRHCREAAKSHAGIRKERRPFCDM